MSSTTNTAAAFRALHVPGRPLLMPNPADPGTARMLAGMGFSALATTSSGHAATLGLRDGRVGRDTALTHAAAIVGSVDVPVSADLENGYGRDPDTVFTTVAEAAQRGLAGCSIEDFAPDPEHAIYGIDLAAERVAAAARAAGGSPGIVLTARAENFIRGNPDLDDTIARLRAYEQAGADVLYAPGLTDPDHIRRVLAAVDRPVNVLTRPGAPTVAELADMGVARISVGGSFTEVAMAAVARAGRELLDHGTYTFLDDAAQGHKAVSGLLGER